jgi:hypothetical protein
LDRIYFASASLLFLVSAYQVDISGNYLEKQSKMMPAHLEKAFLAGCYQNKNESCKQAAAKFRKEQEQIFN